MRFERWLGARCAPWVVLAIAIALAAPALTADFTADDHLHRVLTRQNTGIDGLPSRPLDLFTFANGDARLNGELRDGGLFPWYTDPELKLAFWRPLSSVTHLIDHALWPDSAPLQLAHDLAWHALTLLIAWYFFRRFIDAKWIAVLALALYAWDDARGPVVGWIANRNALVALAIALPALLAHDRWRREGWLPGRILGPLLYAVALLAGESAIALLAYVAAYALWIDRKLLPIVTYLVVTIVWKVIYAKLGYGTFGSGIYVDPGADPIGFAHAAAVRVPFLLLGQFGGIWSDFAAFYPLIGAVAVMLLVALLALALVGLATSRILYRDPVARFFATGTVLAAIPVASTFPADRLLPWIGLGGAGLIAQLLAAALRHREQLGDGRARRAFGVIVAIIMAIIHVVLAPPLLVARSRSMVAVAKVIDRADAGIPGDKGTVIIAAVPSDALAGYTPIMRASRNQPRPTHLYWLASASTAVTFERVDATTLRVTPEHGFLHYEVDRMMRARPFAKGEHIAMPELDIEIEALDADGMPASVLARTPYPFEHYTWLKWQGHSYVTWTPPLTKETLPPVEFLKLLGDD